MSIEFSLSEDPRLLGQYYQLRQECFRKELGVPDFDGSEDEQDREGQVLLAVQNGRCVGGARIASTASLQDQLRELDLAEDSSCMWERFVLAPSVRKTKIGRIFFEQLIDASKQLGYRHALVLSTLRNARLYRQCHCGLGITFQIYRHAPECERGAFASFKHYLSIAYLQEDLPLRIAA